MKKDLKQLVPPDGGWGWMVCFAYALNNVIVLPLVSGFGLIFQETFSSLGITATQTAIIINTNHAFGMALSLFGGPLLRAYGYRKVAVAGALFTSCGILITSQATTFIHFIISYSLMTSIGIAFAMSSFMLAINSYFRDKRGRAMAVGMSITGLGPIIMPQVMTWLISSLGVQGAVLVLGALSLHSLPAALLLRPIKWYLKTPEIIAQEQEMTVMTKQDDNIADKYDEKSKAIEHVSEDEDDYLENRIKGSVKSLQKENRMSNIVRMNLSTPDIRNYNDDASKIKQNGWWKSLSVELNYIDYDSIEDLKRPEGERHKRKAMDESNVELGPLEEQTECLVVSNGNAKIHQENIKNNENANKQSIKYQIVKFFELGLLRDPIFVNIMVGLSLAACAEINFALLTPFILNDLMFTTSQIATIMSVIAFADILFRFVSPFIGDWCKKSARTMYLFSLVMLICTRTTVFFATSYTAMLFVALALGVSKGVRSVYLSLVMPNYVHIDKLAFAQGIQMLTNGIILMLIGPLLGVIRDRSGSYYIPIIFINIVTTITICMWVTEFCHARFKSSNSNNNQTS